MITYLVLGTLLAGAIFAIGIVCGMMLAAIEIDYREECRRSEVEFKALLKGLRN